MPQQGVHKIVKKHDKLLPHAPCQQFYIAHLHQQPWVQVCELFDLHMHISVASSDLESIRLHCASASCLHAIHAIHAVL